MYQVVIAKEDIPELPILQQFVQQILDIFRRTPCTLSLTHTLVVCAPYERKLALIEPSGADSLTTRV